MATDTIQLIGNRYQLMTRLGSGAMGEVYEAHDRLYHQRVALKQVSTKFDIGGSQMTANSATQLRLALANEFQVLSSLRHPNIIGVSDYGFHNGQPYYTMQYVDSPINIRDYAQGKTLQEQVRVIVDMLRALEYLHRRNILHRDLKPDNALVSVDGDVYVLDFGLATLYESKTEDEAVVGTIAYMAPEVLQIQGATASADLYAVGTIAYEIFAGHHPFQAQTVMKRITQILTESPDLSLLDVPPAVAQVVGRLLSKDPTERFQHARDVIRALDDVTDFTFPRESVEIRESYLQAAKFVGRDQEYEQLRHAVDAVLESKGSAWLIGGESGVGKSRLINEIRTLALVKGALVLDGQAVVEGGLSYQMWLNPLRRLALSVDLQDEPASVLKQVVPNIDQLLGRDIPTAPKLDGQVGQQRLIDTIGEMFLQYDKPIVLFLEDLQWAGESLEVVRELITQLENDPVLLIGTFRSDERPTLPDEISDMNLMILDRLDNADIADLSVSILGEAGRDREIIDLLNRETEGNVFFLVEVIRALAEQAGQLANIQTMTLPVQVFAQGISRVVERRLSQVPADAKQLLETAAVAGRQLDLTLLKTLANTIDLDTWLTNCVNAAVLEGIDGQWRFSHEKLREGIIGTLPEATLKTKHEQVARTLIDVYPDLHDEYAAVISDHYDHAGQTETAVQWHMTAGAHARTTFATATGVHHYRRALSYWREQPDSDTKAQKLLTIYRELGIMLIWQAEFEDASEMFMQLLELAISANKQEIQARGYWGLAVSHFRTGNPTQAFKEAETGEALADAFDLYELASELLAIQGMCQYAMGDLQAGREFATQALAMSERNNHEYATAQSLNLRGVLDMNLGIFDEAEADFRRALAIFESLGVRPSSMSVVNNLGLIAIFRGEYETAVTRYRDAIRRAQEAGQIHLEMEFTSNLGEALVRLGEYDTAIEKLQWVVAQADRRGFAQISETYRFLAEAYLGANQIEQAVASAENALMAGYDVDYQEFIAGALNVLGQVLAVNNARSKVIHKNRTRTLTVSKCFKDADKMFNEMGMSGERARNLRAWAQYEIKNGDREQGLQMWGEARQLFETQGATAEVERMDAIDI